MKDICESILRVEGLSSVKLAVAFAAYSLSVLGVLVLKTQLVWGHTHTLTHIPTPAAAESALWHCGAFSCFHESVGVQPLPQTSLSPSAAQPTCKHTLPAGLWHTLNLEEEPLLQFRRDSFLIASPSVFLLRGNRFPCSDLILGSQSWALIRERCLGRETDAPRRAWCTNWRLKNCNFEVGSGRGRLESMHSTSQWVPSCLHGELKDLLVFFGKASSSFLTLFGTDIFHPSPGWKRIWGGRGVKASGDDGAKVRAASLELISANYVF